MNSNLQTQCILSELTWLTIVVFYIDIGFFVDEDFDKFNSTEAAGMHQRRVAVDVLRVDVGFCCQQFVKDGVMAAYYRLVERCEAHLEQATQSIEGVAAHHGILRLKVSNSVSRSKLKMDNICILHTSHSIKLSNLNRRRNMTYALYNANRNQLTSSIIITIVYATITVSFTSVIKKHTTNTFIS